MESKARTQVLEVTEENPLGETLDAIPENINSLDAVNEVARLHALLSKLSLSLALSLALSLPTPDLSSRSLSPPLFISLSSLSLLRSLSLPPPARAACLCFDVQEGSRMKAKRVEALKLVLKL